MASMALAAEQDTLNLPSASAQGRAAPSGPADSHRIDAEALQRFASVEDAVNSLPGFHVREEGGLGGYSELSFRGSDAGSVDIYLDGLRLNQEGEEAPDLAKLPLLWFSGLEERSGFEAFGAGGPGSLARIDLSTAADSSGHAEIRGRAGSFGTAEGAATVHGGRDWKWTIGVEGQTARNDYPFFNDNGTIYTTSDDAVQRLQNNAYWSRGVRAALSHDGAFWSQSFSLLWLDYLKEYPGIPNTASDPQAYTRHNEWMGGWRAEAFPGRSRLEVDVQAKRFDDAYHDPDQSLGYLSYEEARTGTSVEAGARSATPLTEKLNVTTEAHVGGESVDPTATPYSQQVASPSLTRQEARLGETLQERITRDFSLTAEAGVSGIHFRAGPVQPIPQDTPRTVSRDLAPLAFRIGTQWRTPVGSFEALGRYEERAPSAEELMGDNNGIRPNPDVDPQKTWIVSLTHEWKRKDFQAQTTAFWHRYEDPIRLAEEGRSSFLQYGNGDAYRAIGFEEDGRVQERDFESRVSLTVQSIEIQQGIDGGFWPAYQSPFEGHAEAFWNPRTSVATVMLGPMLDVLGPYYTGDVNSVPGTHQSSEWEWGAHLGAQRRRVNVSFDARNLLNRNYRDFAYSVRSGRSYSLSLSINI